jgi:hypothetical protein
MLPYVAGVVLSIGVALFARWVGFDRDRAFYPTVLIVIASYYVLFAVMSGSVETVLLESIIMALFAAAAVAGFKASAWIVVAALAGHGVQDAVHGHIVANAGVPAWCRHRVLRMTSEPQPLSRTISLHASIPQSAYDTVCSGPHNATVQSDQVFRIS